MSDHHNHFFLQVIDPQYGCAILEAMFTVSDLSDLRNLLGACAEEDPELRFTYSLRPSELAAITQRYGVAVQDDGREVRLDRWHPIRAAPYLIHTNYELLLLLDGEKKLARMSEKYPPHQHLDEDLFERHVVTGFLHREVEVIPFPEPFGRNDGCVLTGERIVYYTLQGEEWRIPAWKLLLSASEKTGWNVTFERLEGMLLGYQGWQMDWWIAQWRRPPLIRSTNPALEP